MDKKVSKELEKRQNNEKEEESLFPEHAFLLTCLRIGLTIQDLKEITYIDVIKMFLSFSETKEDGRTKTATQRDIDRLLG